LYDLEARAATVKGYQKLFELLNKAIFMRIVIKIGGSLLFNPDGFFNTNRFEAYASAIHELKKADYQPILVLGGGKLAKQLIAYGESLGASRDGKDRLGIAATWICAQLMITALSKDVHPVPITTEKQLTELLQTDALLVLGGLTPGQSTNAVAARVAELSGARLVLNVTDVDGVYTLDPRRYSEAELISELSVPDLRKIVEELEDKPGTYPLFDRRALDIVERAKLEVWFVNGQYPERLVPAVLNQEIGTRLFPG
jgi:uridylate kinase